MDKPSKAAVVEDRNGSPSPPTTEVPVDGAPPWPDEAAVTVGAAPVWEGGDPGVAVPSADDQDDTLYHPEPEAPPPPPPPPATRDTSHPTKSVGEALFGKSADKK